MWCKEANIYVRGQRLVIRRSTVIARTTFRGPRHFGRSSTVIVRRLILEGRGLRVSVRRPILAIRGCSNIT